MFNICALQMKKNIFMIEDIDGKKRLINELIGSAAIILCLREIVVVFTMCGLHDTYK